MLSRGVAVGVCIVVVTAFLPRAMLSQQPTIRPRAVVRDTGRATINPRTIVTGQATGVNPAAVAAAVWRKVPGVVGRTVSIASEVIAKEGLVARVQTGAFRSSRLAPGIVVG